MMGCYYRGMNSEKLTAELLFAETFIQSIRTRIQIPKVYSLYDVLPIINLPTHMYMYIYSHWEHGGGEEGVYTV